MRLTALDIREQQFRRVMRGFDPDEVVTFLGTVASEYEQLVAENRDIRQRLLDLEHQIAEFQSMEKALRDTLLTAERVTVETRENAQKEAGLILREAEVAAQQATSGISAEILQKRRELSELQQKKKDYLFSVRALAQSHMQMIDSASQSIEAEASFAAPEAAVVRPVAQVEPAPLPLAGPGYESPADSALPTDSSPLPTEVGGVIPSAVAAPTVEPREPATLAQEVVVPETVVPETVAPETVAPENAWAEASFEPGDLVPRSAPPVSVSDREAEYYRRGIVPGDPLPSLLRASGFEFNEGAEGEAVPQGAIPPESARTTVVNNPTHAVGPDGSQGD